MNPIVFSDVSLFIVTSDILNKLGNTFLNCCSLSFVFSCKHREDSRGFPRGRSRVGRVLKIRHARQLWCGMLVEQKISLIDRRIHLWERSLSTPPIHTSTFTHTRLFLEDVDVLLCPWKSDTFVTYGVVRWWSKKISWSTEEYTCESAPYQHRCRSKKLVWSTEEYTSESSPSTLLLTTSVPGSTRVFFQRTRTRW
jgi:hypothetical protein